MTPIQSNTYTIYFNETSFLYLENLLQPDVYSKIFVLVDEGHRSQYGSFNVRMQQVFPNACFLAFTGTPLMKKEKINHIKINIFPDGGISRFRIFGKKI